MILDAMEVLEQKKLLSEEDQKLATTVLSTVITRMQLTQEAGAKIDQMDCMMNTSFIMGWIKAKRSLISKPKLSIAEEKKTVFWSCDQDQEILTCDSADEAIEQFLDGQEIMPETVTVYGFSRKPVDKKLLTERILEISQEHLDEENGGENGHDINTEIENAAEEFAQVYIDNFESWQCEKNEEITFNTKEWIEKNHPDWSK